MTEKPKATVPDITTSRPASYDYYTYEVKENPSPSRDEYSSENPESDYANGDFTEESERGTNTILNLRLLIFAINLLNTFTNV